MRRKKLVDSTPSAKTNSKPRRSSRLASKPLSTQISTRTHTMNEAGLGDGPGQSNQPPQKKRKPSGQQKPRSPSTSRRRPFCSPQSYTARNFITRSFASITRRKLRRHARLS
ncbi:hypothetical protein E1B28_010898 [Marasmius oreades]|uniref:Uncharacterized protein n=1 Tax=Marasmius oreades TaxID=181124 RepID=A0A9P7RU09_9AGAR|nr:uncharacterized protein E1B28_010898 [Marasmius oreades]KAG7089196.1 hypothetical protein E1B28_010898 [Marasmius oreades]